MANKFASILAALGLGSTTEAATEANLEAADAKIAQLETDKVTAEEKLTTAEANLQTAQQEKGKAEAALTETKGKLATLQEWKDNQAKVDGREEDDSNKLEDKPEAMEPWERAAASTIANTKKRLGEK
jgi:chromosome segregation ATPase